MDSLWSWTALVFLVLRAILEVRAMCSNTAHGAETGGARRHKYEFTPDVQPPRARFFLKALNLTVFVVHTVLLGILFFETERHSVSYWLYAITVYYILQCYLAFIIPRQEPADETAAKYIIYFSLGALLLALLALLWNDFCAPSESSICDEAEADYYSSLWPLQAITVIIFGVIDCLLWARGTGCSESSRGYAIKLGVPARVPSAAMGYASAQDDMVISRGGGGGGGSYA